MLIRTGREGGGGGGDNHAPRPPLLKSERCYDWYLNGQMLPATSQNGDQNITLSSMSPSGAVAIAVLRPF